MSLTCERWMLALKCLRRMLVSGVPNDFKSVTVRNPPPLSLPPSLSPLPLPSLSPSLSGFLLPPTLWLWAQLSSPCK